MNSHYPDCRVAVLAAGSASGEVGGAERFYQGLLEALLGQGCRADLIHVAADESTFERIEDNYARCRAMNLSDYDLVISTKAPTYAICHPRHVLYLVHTTRVFYDMFDTAFPEASASQLKQRQQIHRQDFEAMVRIRHRFSIGHEVSDRLHKWNGLSSEVLHPPLALRHFRQGDTGNYFFLPGRLHPWKRVELVIRAVKESNRPLRLLIAGTGEAEADLKALAGGDTRIEFLGRTSDDALIDLYANALAVPFVPLREDYGYVTLEAFSSGKPVITCADSGEPLYFVRQGQTGMVCQPTSNSLRAAMEHLLDNVSEARDMGQRGLQSIAHITWPSVARRLLDAGFSDELATPKPITTRVAVLDMQPINPPVGGGRLRLLGLYHDLGPTVEARYVGSYDWPGEKYRRHALTPGLEEIDVPLSDAHHAAANQLAQAAGGKTVIDIAFAQQGHLSPGYLAASREALDWADIVIFSHPWVFPLVADRLHPSQVVVYDAQNVEGLLRAQLLDEHNPIEAHLLRGVVSAEYKLGRRADLVLTSSQDDLNLFERIYEWPADKMRVIPNGVMVSGITPPSPESKHAARARLGLVPGRIAAIFIGSDYQPNVVAASFIVQALASDMPEVDFVIAGGVGMHFFNSVPDNVIVTGSIDDTTKRDWLHSVDLAINPMFSGSGTNIKMFEFMAAGLPVVTTQVGARGIVTAGRNAFAVVASATQAAFIEAMRRMVTDVAYRETVASNARACVEDGYACERISAQLGKLLLSARGFGRQARPEVSVVVPTYERHDQLNELVACLQAQIWRDFEVVIVDQSARRWAQADESFGFTLTYLHTPVKGAARARNTGAGIAQGDTIAFTDDDCRPLPDWLLSARKYFKDSNVKGVEGRIESDHHNDPAYRPVTNVGFEGVGFMTANLLVRAYAFHSLGGFDLSFDRPHFREDTDFGWRLQQLGDVPYAHDVRVFHPAQRRAIQRESHVERVRFFEKDALLLAKHPQKYKALFFIESHWKNSVGFWENFERGALKYGVDISEYLSFKPSERSNKN